MARLFSRWCVRVQSDNSLQWDTVKPWGRVMNGLTRAICIENTRDAFVMGTLFVCVTRETKEKYFKNTNLGRVADILK